MKINSRKMSLRCFAVFLVLYACLVGCNSSEVYNTWWTKPKLLAVLYLKQTRERLWSQNLFGSYTLFPDNVPCDNIEVRTIDGTCNDLTDTKMGGVGMRFGRNVRPSLSYPDPNMMEPNPRVVSRHLMERDGGTTVEAGHLSYLATAWIQFMIHDWFAHENETSGFFQVPISPSDPFYDPANPQMLVPKTKRDPSQDELDGTAPAYQNTVTHWWDGSQIYGSDQATNDSVRSFTDGKLTTSALGGLPIDPATGIAVTGFNDNWWVGLAILHQLFVMEHNAIADMLKTQNPLWDDQQLYDTARLINAALMTKIHTLDWTPAILKNSYLREAMNGNWYGHPLAAGLMGSEQDHYVAPFSLTEEFTAVYRMHPLLRESLPVRDYQTDSITADVALENSAFTSATDLMNTHGMANLLYSFGRTKPGALTTNNYPSFLTDFTAPGPFPMKLDLAAVDIIRDRERGVPRYNALRRELGLVPIKDFSDITPDAALVAELRLVYNNDIEAIDALVGQLAEGYRPGGYGFGETAFTVFISMASRRLKSDRFYTDYYTAEYYTEEGMDWIEGNTINSVILRHMPELAPAMENVGNAFFPWDEDSTSWNDFVPKLP